MIGFHFDWRRTLHSLPRFAYRGFAAGLAVFVMEFLATADALPLPLVPFVTSIVLTVAAPEFPASRPYAIIVGHVLSALSGVAILLLFGQGEIVNGAGVGVSLFLMLVFHALHPPAALDAFVATSQAVHPLWIIVPILSGAILLAVYGRAAYWLERRLFDRSQS